MEHISSGSRDTSSVTVFIAAQLTVTINCSSPVIVDEYNDVRCLCKGEGGIPPANVTWYKDGVQIDAAGDEEKLLTLSNVDRTYNGTYKCVAQSYTLTTEKSIEVEIRPNFTPVFPVVTSLTFKPEKVILGQPVTITCEADARPSPTWYIIFHNCSEVHNSNKNTYTIQKVKDSDVGLYKCIAKIKLRTSEPKYYIMTFQGPLGVTTTATAAARTTNGPIIKNSTTENATCNKSDNRTEWYIIVVSLLSGIIVGILLSYIFVSSRRRFRNGKPQPNPVPQISNVNSISQDLDLSKMNAEDNYQSLRVNSATNDADYENQNDSTYTELNTVRDVENNYQSLT